MDEKVVNKRIDDEIKNLFERLSQLDEESDEYRTILGSIQKLTELKLKVESKDEELFIKTERDRLENRRQYIKLGIEAAGVVLPLVFYGVWMSKGLKFEETGTFTSTTFKNLINKFKTGK